MTEPSEWNVLLDAREDWRGCYLAVEVRARRLLERDMAPNDLISTGALVEALYPAQFARGEGITARRRIFKALAALATRGLSDCCTKGEPKRLAKTTKYVRPWLWHAPAAKQAALCPHCGGEL